MNYIGSKFSLLSDIERVLDAHGVPATGTALDLFAGTGVVAQFLKRRGYRTLANDWQWYSHLTCVALIEHNGLPEFTGLDRGAAQVLSYLGELPGKSGKFYETYCEGGAAGRLYFSESNGLRIQAIRDQIEEWGQEQLISSKEKAWLVASLIDGADEVANTASVYGAYLKRIKPRAAKPLRLEMLHPTPSDHNGHKAVCMDSETLLRNLSDTRLQLVYIDPPYNARQYSANYHILETLARWDLDDFEPKGVTGLRASHQNRSDYCMKRTVRPAFRKLIAALNADYVLFSYNNEGLVSREELVGLIEEFCDDVHLEEVSYKRFRADIDGENRVYKGDSTTEYLILGKMKGNG